MLGKKALVILVFFVAVGVGGYLLLENIVREQIGKETNNSAQKVYKDGSKIELEGKKVCLKPKKQPATRECMTGFLAEDGRYYALENIEKLEGVAPGRPVWVKGIYRKTSSAKYRHSGTVEIQSVSIKYNTPAGLDL